MKIAIIGAGISGLTAAYYLARDGHEIEIFEQESYAAMQCSYANGAQISVSNSEVWTTWSNVWKAIKWLGKKDAPLLIRPSLNPDKIIWLLKFLYHTANNDYAKNTVETIRLGIESRILLDQLVKDEHIQYDEKKKGILHIYSNPKYFKKALDVKEMYEGNGCEWQPITSLTDIVSIEPGLKYKTDICGSIYTSSDWTGDIHKFCIELAEVLSSKYGVRFRFNDYIDWQQAEQIFKSYDRVVIAAGVGSKDLGEAVGETIRVYPVKGYSITIELEDSLSSSSAPQVSLLDDEAKIVCSRLGQRLRIAGTAEFDGYNVDIRRNRIEPLLKWTHNNFPDINTHNYSSWACLRPMTPNMMPIVRPSRNPKYYFHTGHGHLGWTLAAKTAKLLAEQIKGNNNVTK